MYTTVFCPRCGFSFKAETTTTGKSVGGIGGLAAGAMLGAKIGIVAGPLGAIAGTLPGAILGGIFGKKAGNAFDKPQCPQCGQTFDMIKPDSISGANLRPLNIFTNLSAFSELIIQIVDIEDEFDMVIHGTATLAAIVKQVRINFDINVVAGSPIAKYMIALKNQDFEKMAKIIRAMVQALQEMDTDQQRGEIIYFFFTDELPA
jgi:ribosomal protein S27AE